MDPVNTPYRADDSGKKSELLQRTRHGGVGDPRTATAEKGERLLAASAAEVAATVLDIRQLTPFE